ncbi:MAG: hypothetical protein HY559_04255 [Gammaproteobacteria bacterium]|nr:hypothetical protein [Gammaproteobacteria bacterium]
MSLINQMLKDLETRKVENQQSQSSLEEATLPTLEGEDLFESRRGWIKSGIGVLFFVSLAVGFWQFYGKEWMHSQNKTVLQAITQPLPLPEKGSREILPPPVQAISPSEPIGLEDKDLQEAVEALEAPEPVVQTKHTQKKSVIKTHPRISKEDESEQAYQLGLQFANRSQDEAAKEQFLKSLSAWKHHHSAREALVTLQIKRGFLEQARESVEEGRMLAPSYLPFVKLLARIYVLKKQNLEALELLKQHAPPKTQDLEYYAFMAAIHSELMQFSDAVSLYQTILEVRPEHSNWRMGLARALEKEGRKEAALSAYQMALKGENLNASAVLYVKGRIQVLKEE